MQFGSNMEGLWIDENALPGFKSASLDFMHRVQHVSEQLMSCLAIGLGFPPDYFVKVHDITRPDSQTVARLLHYFETPRTTGGEVYHRAGAHTDWDLLTLLFQKSGQSGLEICPGRDVSTEFGHGDTWTRVEPEPNAIICNVGDLLMSWSDDRVGSPIISIRHNRTLTVPDIIFPRHMLTGIGSSRVPSIGSRPFVRRETTMARGECCHQCLP